MPKPLQFKSGSLIYARGEESDKIYIIHNGKVSLVSEDIETGADIRDQVQSGEFFGVQSALGHYPRDESAIAVADSIIMMFTIPEFEALALSNTSIILSLLRMLSSHMRHIHDHVSRFTKTNNITPDEGLCIIGERYMKLQRYLHAQHVFNRYLTHFPAGNKASRVTRNLQIIDVALALTDDNDRMKNAAPAESAAGFDEIKDKDADLGLASFERFAKVYQPDEIIFSEYEPGDTFYLIQSGRVKLVKNAGKHERILDILTQPEIFGEMAILEDSPRTASAIALDEVTVLELTAQNFEILLLGNPHIALRLLRVFSKRIYEARRRFMIFILSDPHAKFADVLIMLDETQANIKKEGNSREFRNTVDDIALWAGMSVDMAKEAMNYFITQKRLEKLSDRIVVRNINDLARFVSSRRSQY